MRCLQVACALCLDSARGALARRLDSYNGTLFKNYFKKEDGFSRFDLRRELQPSFFGETKKENKKMHKKQLLLLTFLVISGIILNINNKKGVYSKWLLNKI